MNEDLKRSVDIEADLDDQDLSQVRFGRNRFLRFMSLGLFGLFAGGGALVAAEDEAEARRRRGRRVPPDCGSSPKCSSCDQEECSGPDCVPDDAGCTGEGDGEYCWITKTRRSGGRCSDTWRCCDYRENGDPCHCYGHIKTNC